MGRWRAKGVQGRTRKTNDIGRRQQGKRFFRDYFKHWGKKEKHKTTQTYFNTDSVIDVVQMGFALRGGSPCNEGHWYLEAVSLERRCTRGKTRVGMVSRNIVVFRRSSGRIALRDYFSIVLVFVFVVWSIVGAAGVGVFHPLGRRRTWYTSLVFRHGVVR